ncbi:Putative bifunctional phosphatase/peptidyl-prolyl cis-trans isomerase [Tessaracoccus sp. O5.2]
MGCEMPKAVFIDFDGTYADRGQVPAGHVAAVREARRNGHHVFLCTGRPKAMVPPRILDSVFDGMVGAAGGYVEVGDRVLADTRFPGDLAERVVAVLAAHDATFILEAPDALYGPPGIQERLREILGAALGSDGPHDGVDDILRHLRAVPDPAAASFGKVTIFASPVAVSELAHMVGPRVGALPNSVTGLTGHAGEIHLRGVNKAVGIEVAAAHLGVERGDIIGIGDGHNDLEMLAHAGTAVVVEGAAPEVMALADHVVEPPHRSGLVRGFAELGLTAVADDLSP